MPKQLLFIYLKLELDQTRRNKLLLQEIQCYKWWWNGYGCIL